MKVAANEQHLKTIHKEEIARQTTVSTAFKQAAEKMTEVNGKNNYKLIFIRSHQAEGPRYLALVCWQQAESEGAL
jgi:hypothetical protein